MKFSAFYMPTTLFSLRDSACTASGAKSLFLPSPYAIKMAIINQVLTLEGQDYFNEHNDSFDIIKNLDISYRVCGYFISNNCLIKIQKKRDQNSDFNSTVSYREYIHASEPLEIIFGIDSEDGAVFLKKYLFRINYFGKRGCYFQFLRYSDSPSSPNVLSFDNHKIIPGIIQEYDDINKKMKFENVNSYSKQTVIRDKKLLVIPLIRESFSKSYTKYKVFP
ncbi:MAG: hypothetical protein LKE41_00800 [Prevotella sp.]|jgi:hypothetical protein|nr:hypothetical protein [Prevotella sp.]